MIKKKSEFQSLNPNSFIPKKKQVSKTEKNRFPFSNENLCFTPFSFKFSQKILVHKLNINQKLMQLYFIRKLRKIREKTQFKFPKYFPFSTFASQNGNSNSQHKFDSDSSNRLIFPIEGRESL